MPRKGLLRGVLYTGDVGQTPPELEKRAVRIPLKCFLDLD